MSVLELQNKIIQEYRSNEVLKRLLKTAYQTEIDLKEGQSFGDELLYQAWINPKTGFWNVVFKTSIGDIYCNELEENIQSIEIITFDNNSEEPNYYSCEIGDFKSLKKLQQKLEFNPIISQIKIDSFNNKSAAEVFVFLLRRFRKELLDYQKTFAFLWEGTGFNNALDLGLACK